MIRRFVYDRDLKKVVEVTDLDRRMSRGLTIIPDIEGYVSPCTDAEGKHPFISSRNARREDLKRNDCVEIDPGYFRSLREKRNS